MELDIGSLSVNDIGIEVVVLNKDSLLHPDTLQLVKELNVKSINGEKVAFGCTLDELRPGLYEFGLRIYPANAAVKYRQHFPLVKWI